MFDARLFVPVVACGFDVLFTFTGPCCCCLSCYYLKSIPLSPPPPKKAEIDAAIALLARTAASEAAAKLEADAKAQAEADLNMGVVSPLGGE